MLTSCFDVSFCASLLSALQRVGWIMAWRESAIHNWHNFAAVPSNPSGTTLNQHNAILGVLHLENSFHHN